MCKKILYKIEFNPTTKTWCIFKHIESEHSYNFYSIYEDVSKKKCIDKLKEVLK